MPLGLRARPTEWVEFDQEKRTLSHHPAEPRGRRLGSQTERMCAGK